MNSNTTICKGDSNDMYTKNDFDFNGKNDKLLKFYTKFPHFNYKQFSFENNLKFKNEDDTIRYVTNNYTEEEIYIQNLNLNLFYNFNIKIVKCINNNHSDLSNCNKYNLIESTNYNLQVYDSNIDYLLIDSINMNMNINEQYKNKIILYVNNDILEKVSLINKFKIKYFILKNNSFKNNLLENINDYNLITEDNNFDTFFHKIYNYKKKYETITDPIEFENFYDIDIEITVKSQYNNLKLKVNGTDYVENINPNILNKVHIYLKNTNKIDLKYLSQISFISFKYRKENEKIEQLYLTCNLYKYKDDNRIHKIHGLKDYYDINKPSFFYGIPRKEDVDKILNHKGKKYIIFSGGDIDLLFHINKNTQATSNRLQYLKKIHSLDEVYYIPRSSFMINDMKLLNYKYTYIPFFANTFANFDIKPKGDMIYFYTYPDEQKFLYGHSIIEKIKKIRPDFKFLELTHPKAYETHKKYCLENNITTCKTNEDLIKYYQRCFVSIRLTNHDGIANSVYELGTLGIKTIYNDTKCPCALNYTSLDDIINHIENERKKIGTIDYSLIEKVKNYVIPSKEIYNTNYYE
jgi:hypothetical protein